MGNPVDKRLIKDLEGQISELTARHAWISVNDRLPKPLGPHDLMYLATRYLVAVNDGPRSVGDGRIVEPFLLMRFMGWEYFGGWEHGFVTHWKAVKLP